jgi:hypothetical protein
MGSECILQLTDILRTSGEALVLASSGWAKCHLGRNANPCVATAHPRINEALAPRIWLRLFNPFDAIDSSHEHSVVKHVRSHVLVDRLIYTRTSVLQAGEILGLVPQTAVVADVNQGIVE